MKKQFLYERTIKNPKKTADTPDEPDEISVYDTFNVDLVIRTYTLPSGKMLVLLADGHEESQDKPVAGKKGVELKRERSWLQSQIEISETEAQRFRDLYSV